jgi:hypothetical protein
MLVMSGGVFSIDSIQALMYGLIKVIVLRSEGIRSRVCFSRKINRWPHCSLDSDFVEEGWVHYCLLSIKNLNSIEIVLLTNISCVECFGLIINL